jgi:MFS transporter, FSR family, fosmidomycin resistance protein
VAQEIDRRAIAALSAGHFATDFSNGALPALLPFLVTRFDLSYTAVGALMLVSALSSSIVQPLFGLWSDRRGAIWLLPAGVVLAGGGMALAAASSEYWLCLVFVAISGLGTAAYHPEG